MDVVIFFARAVLGASMATAGAAKLLDLRSFDRAVRALGVPERVAPVVARMVPLVELALAVGLVVDATARAAAVLAAALLLAFTSLLAWNLHRGRRPACNCFGSSAAEPIGARSVIRNIVLVAIAGVAAGDTNETLPTALIARLDVQAVAQLAAGVLGAVLLLGAVLFTLVRARTAGGTSAPVSAVSPASRVAPSAMGESVAHLALRNHVQRALPDDVPLLAILTDPDCSPCRALLPSVEQWQTSYAGIVEIVVVTASAPADHYEGVGNLIVDPKLKVSKALHLLATPSAVLVAPDDTLGSATAEGALQIASLVTDAALDGRPSLEIGDPAGALTLPNERGVSALSEHAGAFVLLVFWDPSCGFCQELEGDLRRWEARSDSAQRLIIASQGSADATRAAGFAHVLEDQSGAAMRGFAGYGTPSAVLIDATGQISSEIAHGRPEVMALAERSDLLTRLSTVQAV